MSRKILITGLNGFVGRNLSAHLKSNFEIYGLTRKAGPSQPENIYTWDTFSKNELEGIETIIHLAGKAHDLKKTANEQEYFEINTELTKRLFNDFLESTAQDFIYMSSVKAVADRVTGELTEDIAPEPHTAYGRSKQKAEEYLLSQQLPPGRRLFILRPCMIHGPGNKGNLNLLYKFAQKGLPYPLAAFENRRSFLSIENLNFVIDRIISNPNIEGGIYNIADTASLATNDVIKIIAQTCRLNTRLWYVNPSLIKFMAAIGDKIKLPLNTERLNKLTENYLVSNQKIKDALGVSDLPVSSVDGLITTIKSFKGGSK